jgi:poly-beta-1,6-N-acetyl-D-glucosamine synthase
MTDAVWALALFYGALLVLLYTYVGYPLCIALWAKMFGRKVWRGTHEPLPGVAIIVVVYNEAARIRAKLETCLAQDYPAELLSVVVVSDGSTDDTAQVVAEFAQRRVRWLPFETRRGKAACLNDAVAQCPERVLVFTDARQMLNAQAVRCLVENLFDPKVGAVSGELMLVQADMTPFGEGVDAYWRYEKFIRQREAMVHSAPGATGALYALRRKCFVPIPANTILDDVAIPMQAVRKGYRVVFDNRAHAYDQPSQSPAQERLRKVRTLAGNYQLVALMPWLLLPWRNRIFVQFVSHKLLRLIAPLFLGLALFGNMVLAWNSLAYGVVLLAHLAGYWLAVFGPLVERLAPLRVTKLASAFVLLNTYAVMGLRQFLTTRDGHLWSSHGAAAAVASDQEKT